MRKSDRMMLDSFPPSGRRAIAAGIRKVCPLLSDLPFISSSFCPSLSSKKLSKQVQTGTCFQMLHHAKGLSCVRQGVRAKVKSNENPAT